MAVPFSFVTFLLGKQEKSKNRFDDVKFTYTPTRVIQYNEYYPFGLQTSNSWTRHTAKDNDYLYNSGSELNETTGWYEMFFRGYDAALGRMLQVDPMAFKYHDVSTYHYAGNNPVLINDPTGAEYYYDGATKSWVYFDAYGNDDREIGNGGGRYSSGAYSNAKVPTSFYGGYSYAGNAPGSGNSWSDGSGYGDWSFEGGSSTYRSARAAGGVDIGGTVYNIGWDAENKRSTREAYDEQNGEVGYWVMGGYRDTEGAGVQAKFVKVEGAQQGGPGDPPTNNPLIGYLRALEQIFGFSFELEGGGINLVNPESNNTLHDQKIRKGKSEGSEKVGMLMLPPLRDPQVKYWFEHLSFTIDTYGKLNEVVVDMVNEDGGRTPRMGTILSSEPVGENLGFFYMMRIGNDTVYFQGYPRK